MSGPYYDSVLATVSGWGALASGGSSPDSLREVNVTTMGNAECQVFYEGNEDITDNMLCAASGGKDACQGDSGGNNHGYHLHQYKVCMLQVLL